MPSSRPARTERVALIAFGAGATVLALTWLLGFSLRAPIWSEDIENIRRSGLFRIYGGDAINMVNTALLMLLLGGGYIAALWGLYQGIPRSFATAAAASVLVMACVLPVAPLTSPDAAHLAADVRTFWRGTDPTGLHGPPAQQNDPVAKEVRVFSDLPSGYGPVAYAIGGASIPFVGDTLRWNVFGVKVVAALFLLAAGVTTGLVARKLGYEPGFAMAFVTLNPLMLWEFVADGHNDPIMVAFGMGAILLAVQDRVRWRLAAAPLAVLSVAAKYAMIVVSPVFAAWWVERIRLAPPAWLPGPIVAVLPKARPVMAGVAIAAGVGAALIIGLDMLPGGTAGPATGLTRNTPWTFGRAVFDTKDRENWLFGVCYAGIATTAGLIILRHRIETARDALAAAALLMAIFLFVLSPNLRHWYQLWCLPLVAVGGRRWLMAAAVAFSLGAFSTLLALNWQAAIQTQMGIKNPVDNSVLYLWVLTVSVALFVWYRDRDAAQRAAAAEARRTQRRLPGRPAGAGSRR
ncbi:MAG: hypothetical protein U0547_03620 [Dehalococcoidia bacterium]